MSCEAIEKSLQKPVGTRLDRNMLYEDEAMQTDKPSCQQLDHFLHCSKDTRTAKVARKDSGVGECHMLIVTDDHLRLAGIASLGEPFPTAYKRLLRIHSS